MKNYLNNLFKIKLPIDDKYFQINKNIVKSAYLTNSLVPLILNETNYKNNEYIHPYSYPDQLEICKKARAGSTNELYNFNGYINGMKQIYKNEYIAYKNTNIIREKAKKIFFKKLYKIFF